VTPTGSLSANIGIYTTIKKSSINILSIFKEMHIPAFGRCLIFVMET
jgi:hypothetical protein